MAAKNPATVLVVNDDAKMLALFVELLGDEGYKIITIDDCRLTIVKTKNREPGTKNWFPTYSSHSHTLVY